MKKSAITESTLSTLSIIYFIFLILFFIPSLFLSILGGGISTAMVIIPFLLIPMSHFWNCHKRLKYIKAGDDDMPKFTSWMIFTMVISLVLAAIFILPGLGIIYQTITFILKSKDGQVVGAMANVAFGLFFILKGGLIAYFVIKSKEVIYQFQYEIGQRKREEGQRNFA